MTPFVATPTPDIQPPVPAHWQVLIVDDEPGVVEELAHGLRLRGYRVLTATSGVEAWNLLTTRTDIGVAVCDIRMPGMDGHALTQAIATRNRDGHRTQIIMISGHGTSRDEAIATEAGAVAFLNKPFRASELRTALGIALLRADGDDHASGNAVNA